MKFKVSGIFEIETEAKDAREAEMKAYRAMKSGGATVLHASAENLEAGTMNFKDGLNGNKFYGG